MRAAYWPCASNFACYHSWACAMSVRYFLEKNNNQWFMALRGVDTAHARLAREGVGLV